MPEHKSLFGSPRWRIIVPATRKESSTLPYACAHVQLVLWQASLALVLKRHLKEIVLSERPVAANHAGSPVASSLLDIQDRMYEQEVWEEREPRKYSNKQRVWFKTPHCQTWI